MQENREVPFSRAKKICRIICFIVLIFNICFTVRCRRPCICGKIQNNSNATATSKSDRVFFPTIFHYASGVKPCKRVYSYCKHLKQYVMICRNIRGHSCPRGRRAGGGTDRPAHSISVSTLLSHARVGNRCCIICITCITCLRIAGAAWRFQTYARQFGQVEGRTEVYPVVSLIQGVGEKPFGLLPG